LQSSICSARTHRICATFLAFVERSRDAHATVGMLSHQQATCECARSAILSSISQCNNKPVISRLEFDICPVGFALETMSFWISRGKTTHHTSGGVLYSIQTTLCQHLLSMHHSSHQSLLMLGPGQCMELGLAEPWVKVFSSQPKTVMLPH